MEFLQMVKTGNGGSMMEIHFLQVCSFTKALFKIFADNNELCVFYHYQYMDGGVQVEPQGPQCKTR